MRLQTPQQPEGTPEELYNRKLEETSRRLGEGLSTLFEGGKVHNLEQLKPQKLEAAWARFEALLVEYQDFVQKTREESAIIARKETLESDIILLVNHRLRNALSLAAGMTTILSKAWNPGSFTEKQEKYFDTLLWLYNIQTRIIGAARASSIEEFQQLVCESFASEEVFILCHGSWDFNVSHLLTTIPWSTVAKVLSETLYELMDNAHKSFRKTEKAVNISLDLKIVDGRLEFRIMNIGTGVSEEIGRHVFEKGFSAPHGESEKSTGEGLSLIKRMVQLLHGEITFYSKEGERTEVTLNIPKR